MIASILISPSLDNRITEINKILSALGVKKDHPDLLYFPAESKLGIDSARDIKKHFSFKPFQAKGKVVVLEDGKSLTVEAQNALLKIIEEPPPFSTIILAAESDVNFLPTLLSRCQVIKLQETPLRQGFAGQAGDIKKLLTLTTGERFEYIEKSKERDQILRSIIQYFHENLALYSEKSNLNFLKELVKTEKLSTHNVNIRAILEYLMLVIPKRL